MSNDPLVNESATRILIEKPEKKWAWQRGIEIENVPTADLEKAKAEAERRGVPTYAQYWRELTSHPGYFTLRWTWIERGTEEFVKESS